MIDGLVRHGLVAPGKTVTVLQGAEIARPSWLSLSAGLSGGQVVEPIVGGCTVPVASGHIFLP